MLQLQFQCGILQRCSIKKMVIVLIHDETEVESWEGCQFFVELLRIFGVDECGVVDSMGTTHGKSEFL